MNQSGVDLLRQALNNGSNEGYRAGQVDREDRWPSNHRGNYAYQDANVGYNGYYLDKSDYIYYFRQGFRLGYQDGYSNQGQYGAQSGGAYSLLQNVLSRVLGLQPLQ